MKSTLVFALIVAAMCLGTLSTAWAVTYYQEDFESYASGTWLTGAPGWSQYWPDANTPVTNLTPLTGIAIDGSEGYGGAAGPSILYKTFTPAAEPKVYTLTFNLHAYRGGDGGNTRDSAFGFGAGDGSSQLATWIADAPPGLARWYFYLNGASSTLIYIAEAFNTPVTATITVDQIHNTARGRLDYAAGYTDTGDLPFPNAGLINSVVYTNEYWYQPTRGLDVDNINVTDSPPGSLTGRITLEGWDMNNVSLTPVQIDLVPTVGGSPKSMKVDLTPGVSGTNYTIDEVTPGTYKAYFRAGCWLKKLVTGVEIMSLNATTQDVTLINGDIDGSNDITTTDLSLMLTNMDVTGDL